MPVTFPYPAPNAPFPLAVIWVDPVPAAAFKPPNAKAPLPVAVMLALAAYAVDEFTSP